MSKVIEIEKPANATTNDPSLVSTLNANLQGVLVAIYTVFNLFDNYSRMPPKHKSLSGQPGTK